MTFICKFCESTEYNILDGFYYCNECYRQNEQVFEFDAFGFGMEGILKKTKIQDVSAGDLKKVAKDKESLTTWEAFNYILNGLSHELVEIGVCPEVRLTIFQMWTHYLKKTEVAFFNKDQPALPKLPPIFKRRDAEILYNHQRKSRKRKKSVSSDDDNKSKTTDRNRKRKIARLMNQTQRSEYESEMNDTKTDINKILTSLADVSAADIRTVSGATSTVGPGSLSIVFSTFARSVFKQSFPKKHIAKHANDFTGELKCHKLQQSDLPYDDKGKIMTRMTLFAIIYCALNYHKESIDIGDLIRFCREGHLSYSNGMKFIPRNVSEKEITDLHMKYTRSRVNDVVAHHSMRQAINQIKDILDVEIEKPDMCALSRRYVEELSLPNVICDYVERILVLCPPIMRNEMKCNLLPSYESRAMACVLFILKLLFGVDDTTENEISGAAKVLNKHLEREQLKLKLFVWRDWVEYIEARKVLIEKCHTPSFLRTNRQNTEHYLYHSHMKMSQPEDESSFEDVNRTVHNTKAMQRTESMTQFAKYITETEENRDPKVIETKFITFPPSLTPHKTYMEIIRDKYAHKVEIPSILFVDHSIRDVSCFLEPLPLYNELLQNRTKLEVEKASINLHLQFQRWTMKAQENPSIDYKVTLKSTNSLKWKEKLINDIRMYAADETKDAQEIHERRKTKFLRRQGRSLTEQKHPPNNDSNLFDPDACKDDPLPNPSPSTYDTTVTLKVPHFHYWSHLYWSTIASDFPMYEEMSKNFPKSFQWLINHCASIIEVHPSDLYSQLLIVENQFLYVLKPMNKQKTRLKDRKKEELPRKMFERIKTMKNLW